VTAIVTTTSGGAMKPIIDARTADRYAASASGAFVRKVHDAGSSLGTKNDARSPMASQ